MYHSPSHIFNSNCLTYQHFYYMNSMSQIFLPVTTYSDNSLLATVLSLSPPLGLNKGLGESGCDIQSKYVKRGMCKHSAAQYLIGYAISVA